MNNITEFFQDPDAAKSLVDSLPYGLLVVDEEGRVQAVNNSLAHILSVDPRAMMGKLIGEALGCLYALKNPEKCSSAEYCKNCEVSNLTLGALGKNKKQKARASFQILTNGQVRTVDFLLSAIPFSFRNRRFGLLASHDISRLTAVSLPDTQTGFRRMVGQHPKMKELFETIRQIARTQAPVLIQGETGTGKELVALAIHEESTRAGKYFVPVNCSALPEGLLETELFGHVKGAFTGAIRDKKGRFELADGGTIFLDEMGELSPAMQVKLLRVLQDGSCERVGSENTVRLDVRVISATNKELEKEIASGRFREDLYYRLCVMPITVPPLRERRSDIPILVEHFLAHYAMEFFGKNANLSSKAGSMLMNHNWPGNVRELQNAIQFALAKCQGRTIEPSHLPKKLRSAATEPFTVQHRRPKLQVRDVIRALGKVNGNKNKAAELLGVSRSTLYRFFAKLEDGKTP
jgi:transcriptional regulator with PAS, ATPase and Fis domain